MNGQNLNKDKGLEGNEKLEEAILALQREPSEEMLAHVLTVVRRRMNERGQLIISVDPAAEDGAPLQLRIMQTDDGRRWWNAYTSFDEELKGGNQVMSTFMADIDKLFDMALQADGINGVIINPWNRTLMLDKNLIKIIKG
ncbi:MAG: SseB family protein [Lachnospiraceae bacterium]|nr:SseB family protein [Lachnospiraceae bacterium]